MKKIAVIIPCYNEEKSIIAVIDEIFATLPNAKSYVFDNNSTDKSADLVRAKIAQITQTQTDGGGESPISSLRGTRA
ncbi:glycosyltransferase [Helicobacter sp. T3_23-1056]